MENNYFGDENVLKEQFPQIYDAVKRGKEQAKNGAVGENPGRQDLFLANIYDNRNILKSEHGAKSAPPTETGGLSSSFSYLAQQGAVIVDTAVVDQYGYNHSTNSYVFTEPLYESKVIDPIIGLCLDGEYTLKGTSTFTAWGVNNNGLPILESVNTVVTTSEIVITPTIIVKSVVLDDPVNKKADKTASTLIVYGKRSDVAMSYNYPNVPDPQPIGNKKYAHLNCPFKIEVELTDYPFNEAEPLSDVEFKVALQSSEPEKYGGGAISFNADFASITKTLSADKKKLTIEIPVDWKALIGVNDLQLASGTFKFIANFGVNYMFTAPDGTLVSKRTLITAVTDYTPSNASVYVNSVKIIWGCLGKDTVLITPNGNKKVTEIISGDKILSINGEFVEVSDIYDGYEEKLVKIKCAGDSQTLEVTSTHPVLTEKGFVIAGDLCAGDKVVGENGILREVESVLVIKYEDKIYNIETKYHTPFLASGIIVGDKDLPVQKLQPRAQRLPQEFLDELKRFTEYKNNSKKFLIKKGNVGDDLDELIKWKNEMDSEWFKTIPNLSATAIGHAYDGDVETDRYVVYLFSNAAEKTAERFAHLYDPNKVVFATREEKPVMLNESNESLDVDSDLLRGSFGDDPNMYRPISGGAQISHFKQIDPTHIVVYTGTLGMFVKLKGDDGTYILTNWHVLEELNNDIYQPVYSGKSAAELIVAKSVSGGYTECGDVGLAKINKGFAVNAKSILDVGNIKGLATTRLEVGDGVHKRGRTTGLTHGKVKYIEVTMIKGGVLYKHQIEVVGTDDKQDFCDSGDSGSILLTYDSESSQNSNYVVGLLWGKYFDGSAICSSTKYIFDDYNLELLS